MRLEIDCRGSRIDVNLSGLAVRLARETMESKQLALLCREMADNKKAENIVVLDVRKLSSVTDYFVIASGTSQPHLRAILEEISGRLRDDYDLRPSRSEGATGGNWVVLDYFDVIVHVMHAETRKHYDLESLWGDARSVTPPKPRKKAAAKKAKK